MLLFYRYQSQDHAKDVQQQISLTGMRGSSHSDGELSVVAVEFLEHVFLEPHVCSLDHPSLIRSRRIITCIYGKKMANS